MLASRQSGQRESCIGGCYLATLPSLKECNPWPCSLHTTAWHEIWAETQSRCTETDQDAWGVIWVDPQKPLSACVRVKGVALGDSVHMGPCHKSK